jgi:hypothetical protein
MSYVSKVQVTIRNTTIPTRQRTANINGVLESLFISRSSGAGKLGVLSTAIVMRIFRSTTTEVGNLVAKFYPPAAVTQYYPIYNTNRASSTALTSISSTMQASKIPFADESMVIYMSSSPKSTAVSGKLVAYFS